MKLFLRIFVSVLFLLPIVWLISAALLPVGSAFPTTLRLVPDGATLDNFRRVGEIVPIWTFTLNSLKIVVFAVPLTLITSSMAGFAISQLPKKRQRHWVTASLALLMIPSIALWSTRFFIYKQLGLNDSWLTLIIPALMGSSPFYVLMFYRAFRRLPRAYFDAAQLDGAGVLTTWGKIGLPLARNTVIGVTILSFLQYWGDFISPLLYLSSERDFTLPVALQLLAQMSRSDWPLLMAAATLTMIIPVILFIFMVGLLRRA